MRRLMAVVMAIVAPLGLVLGGLWAAAEPGLPADAQARLSAYLQAAGAASADSVQRLSYARQPWNFTADQSGPTFADSVYFQTTHNQWAQPLAWPLAPWSTTPRGGSVFARPLPYPPSDVWCVRLSDASSAAVRVLFVALHADLHNADWIVHEARAQASLADTLHDLAAIGCDLGLGR